MRWNWILGVFLLIFFSFSVRIMAQPHVAQNGYLDLSTHNFSKKGGVSLQGEWNFFWHSFLDPDQLEISSDKKQSTIKVPGVWNSFEHDQKPIGGQGYGTYYLRVKIPEKYINQLMALRIKDISTAYTLWINGEKKTQVGKPGKNIQSSKPEYKQKVVFFKPQKSIVNIVFHCANFHYTKGGLWENIYLGTSDNIKNMVKQKLGIDLFLIGALFIMALYHFALYLLRTKEKSTLLFGLFLLVVSTRALFRSEMFIYEIWPDFLFHWHVRMEYLCFYAALPIFYWFTKFVFFPKWGKVYGWVLNMLTGIFLLSVLVTDPVFFTGFVVHFEILTIITSLIIIVTLVIAIKSNVDGSYSAVVGFVLFFLAIVNDILRMNLIIDSPELGPLGLFIFIFSQSFMLSQRFSKAFHNIEILSDDLLQLNKANSRFVPKTILQFLNRSSIKEIELGDNVEKEMAILFSDIRNFTSLSEEMTPEENFEFINSYLRQIGPMIRQNHGYVDKYLGDGIMALFPGEIDDAIKASIHIQQAIYQFNKEFFDKSSMQTKKWALNQKQNDFRISAGIGVHTGLLRLGTIGEKERIDATVISKAVNLASRLEGLTKIFHVSIILSETVYDQIDKSQYKIRKLGRVSIRGKKDQVNIYELIDGCPLHLQEKKIKTLADFEKAVDLFLEEDFQAAVEMFEKVLKQNPEDKSAFYYKQLMSKRA